MNHLDESILKEINPKLNQLRPGPEVIKLFFMLNSAEHEILNAHKYENIKKFSTFQAQLIKPRTLFSC